MNTLEPRKSTRIAGGIALASAAALVLSACSGGGAAGGGDGDDGVKAGGLVCVDQYATATVIDDILEGLQEGLADRVENGLKIDIKNPNADAATEQTIAQQFITANCDVVVAVGTAAAQLQANANDEIPVIFSGSSTPVDAGLVESFEAPGGNVTGVADVIDPSPDIDAMLEIMPDMKTIGLIWKLGDPAGDAQAADAIAHIEELGLEHVDATITNGSEVTQAAQSLVSRVDAIQIPGDTTTLSAADGIVAVADDAGIPVFSGTSEAVGAGGVLASGYDYHEVGLLTADLVAQVLDGADPATTPVVVPEVGGFDINVTKLEQLGLEAPQSLLDQALSKI